MPDLELKIRLAPALTALPADAWNACGFSSTVKAMDEDNEGSLSPQLSTQAYPDNPFVSHEFLSSLESSSSVGARTGWQPNHLVVETADGGLIGAAPCYLKSHSQGEYVFDAGWAEAFEQAGGDYYPKLQVSVPFTPVTGPRLLVKPGPLASAARNALVQGLVGVTNGNRLSSAHITFMPETDWRDLGRQGFLLRTDQQFHWHNKGYATFDTMR